MTISGRARLAGVMGWPVGHSQSPRLHGYWLAHYGIDGAYVPLPVRPDDFADALRLLPKLGFRGVNVTIPHKEAALAAVDTADATAQRIGAVNTVVVQDDGRCRGSNTDAFGFIENLRWRHPEWQASAGPVTVVGAGGAARAVAVALQDAGVPSIRLINRTRARAETLAQDLSISSVPIEVHDWESRTTALDGTRLLVNTTSLGMTDQPPLDLDLAALEKSAAVYDIVYVPLETDLLKAARKRGHPVIDGIGMLLHQARPGFTAWFGIEPEVTEDLVRHLLDGATRG